MKNKILLLLCVIPFLLMLAAGLSLKKLSAPLEIESPTKIDVLFGDSIYRVARKMNQQAIFDYPLLIVWYARFMGLAEKIKAGEYSVTLNDSALTVLDKMIKGNVIQYKVTLIEGWTAKRAIEFIQASDGIAATLDSESLLAFLQSLEGFSQYKSIEGLIFPATYKYTRGTKDADILKKAIFKMREEVNALWPLREKGLPYKNRYAALVMASIVEKETGVDGERKQIAGVFVERLKRKMRLQTDPTVIYGMGSQYKGQITHADLRAKTPYNTYKIAGLPPTPIALPGRSSIAAALNPLNNGMLYFVARGDGSHEFSKNLSNHNAAVKKYQLNRTEEYRSTP